MSEHNHPAAGDPEYAGFRISSLWAWTQVDPADDQEGIVAFRAQNGMAVPMIASDQVRLTDLRPIAHAVARQTGRAVQLRRFSSDGDPLEVFEP